MRWTPARDLDLVTNLGTHNERPSDFRPPDALIPRAHPPSPASSTHAGSITAARTATRARVTPCSTTSRTSPFATVRRSAERGAGTRTGCGQRRSEEIGGTGRGNVSTGYRVRIIYGSIRYDRAHKTQMFSRVPAHHVFMTTCSHWEHVGLEHVRIMNLPNDLCAPTRENICERRIQWTRRPTPSP